MYVRKAEKQKLIQKIMICALNEAIRRGAIDLNGKSVDCSEERKSGYIDTTIGDKRTIINWFDAGYDELRISVWWDYRPELSMVKRYPVRENFLGTKPQVQGRPFYKFIGACGSCYLERRTGKFITGDAGNQFFDVYVREWSVPDIGGLPSVQPSGYETSGRVSE